MRALPLALLSTFALLVASTPAGAAVLNGRLTRADGTGVYPVDLDVFDRNGVMVFLTNDTTDVNGNYSVTVPAGRYDIEFNPHPSLRLFNDLRRGITLSTASSVVTTNRVLPAGWYVSGRMRDRANANVVGTALSFLNPTTGAAALAQDNLSGANGRFNTLVPTGVYDIEFIPSLASRKVPCVKTAITVNGDVDLGDCMVENGFLVRASVTDASLFPLSLADLDVRVAGKAATLFTPTDNTAATGVAEFIVPRGVYDITANSPSAATFAPRTATGVVVNGDVTLPNFVLYPGVNVTATCVNSLGQPVPSVDVDADSLPYFRRQVTPNDDTNVSGVVTVRVAPYKYRFDFTPPVASKLLPVVLDSVQITGVRNLGTITHQPGHWVTVRVREPYRNLPVQGANVDLLDLATGREFPTAGDATGDDGMATVVTDARPFRLIVRAPAAGLQDVVFEGFVSTRDTTIDVLMPYSTLAVGGPTAPAVGLAAPWPNPSRDAIHTAITSGVESEVELSAWDLAGRRVATVYRGRVLGRRPVSWDGRDERGAPVAPGVYLLRLSDGRATTSRRVAVMR